MMMDNIHLLSSVLPKQYLILQSIYCLSLVCKGLKIYQILLRSIQADAKRFRLYYTIDVMDQLVTFNRLLNIYVDRYFKNSDYYYCRNNRILYYRLNCCGLICHIQSETEKTICQIYDLQTDFVAIYYYTDNVKRMYNKNQYYYKNLTHFHINMKPMLNCNGCILARKLVLKNNGKNN